MLNTIIIFLLIIGFIVGFRRGLILEIIHLSGYFIAFFTAAIYYKDLAERLTLWIPYPELGNYEPLEFFMNAVNAEEAYYFGISFFLIFFAVKILLQIIGSMLDFIANIPILKQLNGLTGGILGFIEAYLLIFIFLYVLALFPIEAFQNAINGSSLATGIIEHTPIFSGSLKEMWLN